MGGCLIEIILGQFKNPKVMTRLERRQINKLKDFSITLTHWVGTPESVLLHTIAFIAIFGLYFFGLTVDKILLILTTAVSLEAIYLSLFIQLTVNRTTSSLRAVEEDIEDISEDVKELEGDVEEISEDIDQIQVDEQSEEENAEETLDKIEVQLQTVIEGLEHLKKQVHQHAPK